MPNKTVICSVEDDKRYNNYNIFFFTVIPLTTNVYYVSTVCEQHITDGEQAYRIFPLKKTVISSSELSFSVRTVVSASVTYYAAPNKPSSPRLIVSRVRNSIIVLDIVLRRFANHRMRLCIF